MSIYLKIVLSVAAGLVALFVLVFAAAIGWAAFENYECRENSGKYQVDQCLLHKPSGGKFRIIGKSHTLKNGCQYDFQVIDPGALDNKDTINAIVGLKMWDARDEPPKEAMMAQWYIDERSQYELADCAALQSI